MKKLVSIITPCYNGDKFVNRLLDSLLSQTYANIEMFLLDDGSTDNTAEVVKSYIPKFELKGYSLTYVYQENSGQTVAVNNGLKLFQGDYLTWPDSDDFYAINNAIENMVDTLERSNENVSMVRCSAKLLDEYTLAPMGFLEETEKNRKEADLFEDSIFFLNNFWFQPICYMAKTSKILKFIPSRDIYTNKNAGQNWQIMLPLFYKQKCCLISDYLCNVLVRPESHGRGTFKSYNQLCVRNKAYEDTLYNTLNRIDLMPLEEKEMYFHRINKKFLLIEFSLNARFGKLKMLRKIYNNTKSINPNLITRKMMFLYWISFFPLVIKFLILASNLLRYLKNIYKTLFSTLLKLMAA